MLHEAKCASVIIIILLAAQFTSSSFVSLPMSGGSFLIWLLKRLSVVSPSSVASAAGTSLILLAKSSSSSSDLHSPISAGTTVSPHELASSCGKRESHTDVSPRIANDRCNALSADAAHLFERRQAAHAVEA